MVRRYVDNRASPRKKVDIAARLIVPAERYTIIPCRIVDRSRGGMKVEMQASFPLPEKFFLLGDESEDLYECERRWQNGNAAGLKIIDVCVHSNRKAVLANAANAVELQPQVEIKSTANAVEPQPLVKVESTVSTVLPSEGNEPTRRRPRPVPPSGKVTQ